MVNVPTILTQGNLVVTAEQISVTVPKLVSMLYGMVLCIVIVTEGLKHLSIYTDCLRLMSFCCCFIGSSPSIYTERFLWFVHWVGPHRFVPLTVTVFCKPTHCIGESSAINAIDPRDPTLYVFYSF